MTRPCLTERSLMGRKVVFSQLKKNLSGASFFMVYVYVYCTGI